jgi:hypothetical protein
VSETRYGWTVYHDTTDLAGAVGGTVGELRPSLAMQVGSKNAGFTVGEPGVARLDGSYQIELRRWPDGSAATAVTSGTPDGFAKTMLSFQGNALHWSAASQTVNKLQFWPDPGPVADLVSFGADWSKGACCFGTDGIDMVWVEGEGRTQPQKPYASASLMTAPFTSTPTAIQKRRLRSADPKFAWPSTVGCGRAAQRETAMPVDRVRVTRVSDGHSWSLPVGTGWYVAEPLALTCDELYASVYYAGGAFTIARIRLDSLGPGVPAD